jgi:RNA polymerase sigma-70 factor (ECF subfamily)
MDPLVERAQGGDRAALEELLSEVAPSIHRFGLRMCKNAHDADDVLQDTLLSIATHVGEFEGRSSFSSWVFALTRSACTRRRRGLKNKPQISTDLLPEPKDEAQGPERDAELRELERALALALEQLPEDYREVILLRDMEGLSASEAAEVVGISVDALKSRLHRARGALRETLAPLLERGAQPPAATCPDVLQMWSRNLEGDLSASDCAQMEKHIEGCPACSTRCHALRKALWVCQRGATSEVRPEVQAQVKAALAALGRS